MNRPNFPWTRSALLWGAVVSAAGISGGCALFEISRHWPLAQETLLDGSTIALAQRDFTDWTRHQSQFIQLTYSGDSAVHYEQDVTNRNDGPYVLRVVPGTSRAFVVGKESGEVVLSADFATMQSWPIESEQPDWARVTSDEAT